MAEIAFLLNSFLKKNQSLWLWPDRGSSLFPLWDSVSHISVMKRPRSSLILVLMFENSKIFGRTLATSDSRFLCISDKILETKV
jgi:hypothetical protein